MWKAVLYIRNLPARGSLGDPAVFKEAEESHEEMEKGNQGMKMPSNQQKPHTHKH